MFGTSTSRRLGQAVGRYRRGDRHAGSPAPSRSCSQMWSSQLAHQDRSKPRGRDRGSVGGSWPMMISLSLLRGFKTIRKPGKSGPAVVAFLDPGPPLRDFSKKICSKNKILCVDKPTSGSRTEDLAKPISSEPAPSHRPWIGTLGATPERRALPYHAGYEFNASRASFFPRLEVGSCRNQPSRGKTTKTTTELQNARAKTHYGEYCRSTELAAVVPRPS